MRTLLSQPEIRGLVFVAGTVALGWPLFGLRNASLFQLCGYFMGVWGLLILFLFLSSKGGNQ